MIPFLIIGSLVVKIKLWLYRLMVALILLNLKACLWKT